MSKNDKVLFTGLKPTGRPHLGNYFGSLKPFVDNHKNYKSIIMVADYHAFIGLQDSEKLRRYTLEVVRDYLALGLNPNEVIIFKQSDNPHHTELGWIFNCLVTMPFLQQAHAYKDAIAKGKEITAGLFTYPILQAADIALYEADVVPVGEDQHQHLEYTRDVIRKFNRLFSCDLKIPATLTMEGFGTLVGTDGRKMSKSYNNTIPLFTDSETLKKAVMSIVTDSEGKHPANVYAIHSLFKPESELKPIYKKHQGRYGELKKMLLSDLEEFLTPFWEARSKITDKDVESLLNDGAKKSINISNQTLQKIKSAIGVV